MINKINKEVYVVDTGLYHWRGNECNTLESAEDMVREDFSTELQRLFAPLLSTHDKRTINYRKMESSILNFDLPIKIYKVMQKYHDYIPFEDFEEE